MSTSSSSHISKVITNPAILFFKEKTTSACSKQTKPVKHVTFTNATNEVAAKPPSKSSVVACRDLALRLKNLGEELHNELQLCSSKGVNDYQALDKLRNEVLHVAKAIVQGVDSVRGTSTKPVITAAKGPAQIFLPSEPTNQSKEGTISTESVNPTIPSVATDNKESSLNVTSSLATPLAPVIAATQPIDVDQATQAVQTEASKTSAIKRKDHLEEHDFQLRTWSKRPKVVSKLALHSEIQTAPVDKATVVNNAEPKDDAKDASKDVAKDNAMQDDSTVSMDEDDNNEDSAFYYNSKEVHQYHLPSNGGGFIKTYPSIHSANKATNISRFNIATVAKGVAYPTQFVWKLNDGIDYGVQQFELNADGTTGALKNQYDTIVLAATSTKRSINEIVRIAKGLMPPTEFVWKFRDSKAISSFKKEFIKRKKAEDNKEQPITLNAASTNVSTNVSTSTAKNTSNNNSTNLTLAITTVGTSTLQSVVSPSNASSTVAESAAKTTCNDMSSSNEATNTACISRDHEAKRKDWFMRIRFFSPTDPSNSDYVVIGIKDYKDSYMTAQGDHVPHYFVTWRDRNTNQKFDNWEPYYNVCARHIVEQFWLKNASRNRHSLTMY